MFKNFQIGNLLFYSKENDVDVTKETIFILGKQRSNDTGNRHFRRKLIFADFNIAE